MLKKQDKEYEKGSIIFEPLSKISADFEGKKKIVLFCTFRKRVHF